MNGRRERKGQAAKLYPSQWRNFVIFHRLTLGQC